MTLSIEPPQVLLQHHLKALKLPVFLNEYPKVASQCAADKDILLHQSDRRVDVFGFVVVLIEFQPSLFQYAAV